MVYLFSPTYGASIHKDMFGTASVLQKQNMCSIYFTIEQLYHKIKGPRRRLNKRQISGLGKVKKKPPSKTKTGDTT